MSRRQFKTQASSSRAAPGAFGNAVGGPSGFGVPSRLAYIAEPPDFSAVSDPQVVVVLKNLSKKDSITKVKALEDLQAYLTSRGDDIEDSILDAWVTLYPRTSIDNHRRVRQLAHGLQGHISATTGRRFAKYMADVAGPWLAGAYDSDRSVSKTAQEALEQTFTTPEKLRGVRRAYQQPVLGYCKDTLEKETPQSLSDERTVSPDDAEAKHSRVIASILAVVASLLRNLPQDDIRKREDVYEDILTSNRTWSCATHDDSAVRRAAFALLRVCVAKQSTLVESNLNLMSKIFVGRCLVSKQSGSSNDYVDSLRVLSATCPTVWTEHFKGKRTPSHLLRQFLEKGSQGGPTVFWENLSALVHTLPRGVLAGDAREATELLESMHNGINRRDEPRSNHHAAYSTYLVLADEVSKWLAADDQRDLLKKAVLPLLHQYVMPSSAGAHWTVPGSTALGIATQAVRTGAMPSVVESEWPNISAELVEHIRISSPEQSREFEGSQNKVGEEGSRLMALQKACLDSGVPDSLRAVFARGSSSVIGEATATLKTRNGKPFGAARVISALANTSGIEFIRDTEGYDLLVSFIQTDVPFLFLSPSYKELSSILFTLKDVSFFEDTWVKALHHVLNTVESPQILLAIESLLGPTFSFELALRNQDLALFIVKRVDDALRGTSDWGFVKRVLKRTGSSVSSNTSDRVLDAVCEALSTPAHLLEALTGLKELVDDVPAVTKPYFATEKGSQVLARLLFLSDASEEDISESAADTSMALKTLLQSFDDQASKRSLLNTLTTGIAETSAKSASVEALVELAEALSLSERTNEPHMAEQLLPETEKWQSALNPFLTARPSVSLALTNTFGGAIHLLDASSAVRSAGGTIARDGDGYSLALRFAMFTVKLLKSRGLFHALSVERRSQVVTLMTISVQLANDNLGLAGSNDLWSTYSVDVEMEIVDFVQEASHFLNDVLESGGRCDPDSDVTEPGTFVAQSNKRLLDSSHTLTPTAYYNARAFSSATAEMIDIHGWHGSKTKELERIVSSFSRSQDILFAAAVLTGYSVPLAQSSTALRLCNELMANLTGTTLSERYVQGLQDLVLFNIVIRVVSDQAQAIARQRLIFLAKHLITWLQDGSPRQPIYAEVFRALTEVFPTMKDVYGSHWSDVLDILCQWWMELNSESVASTHIDDTILVLHASFKLLACLRGLATQEDPNDDLADAWKDSESAISAGLVHSLKRLQATSDTAHQPMRIVNELLSRELSLRPPITFADVDELYPLMCAQSQPIQEASFRLLHQRIPASQEQVSIDAALEKKDVRLPDELLSLVLDAPSLGTARAPDLNGSFSLALREYLLSWVLIFDHFHYPSLKVKADYAESIKKGAFLPLLLDFIFDYLGHSKGKPVDISKTDVTSYDPGSAENPERETQWLLSHLYYLALKYLSSLSKAWWIECTSRQKILAVESWTERFISPHIINDALNSVDEWSANQDSAADEALLVKVNHRAREITVAYEVDDQTMVIRIVLPGTYPLTQASVEGINRVAVDEKKWQSWLRTTHGVIAFSNNNIVDGLVAWRKNVTGALKGQSECAICYSIISADKQLPSKRCGTCKNIFHSGCLYKWFKSSNASTCPLCRNPFNYG